MIFATVGTQLPFPRLLKALDDLALELDDEIIAQTGDPAATSENLQLHAKLTPQEFSRFFQAARVVVAHAGIGTILSARRWGKPLILLPRRFALGEHRNDHQVATARQVERLKGIHVAWEETELRSLLGATDLDCADDTPSASHRQLTDNLRAFILDT